MPQLEKFQDLLIRELKELHHGEKLRLGAMPKLARAASDEVLRVTLHAHAEQTRIQMARLEEALGYFNRSPRGKSCPAIKDLIREGNVLIAAPGGRAVKDAGLIVIAQKIGHYEICGYGSARTLAQVLGHDQVAALLQESLDEEAAADRQLTDIAVDLYTGDDTAEFAMPCIDDTAFRA